MVYYILVKIKIDRLGLAEVIIDMVVHHHGVSESILTDRGLFFISKFYVKRGSAYNKGLLLALWDVQRDWTRYLASEIT